MLLHEITQTHPRIKKERLGRGIAAGGGKTAGRGTKGQKSRTGANSNIPRTFEGGATGMIQRLPKLKGFKSHRIRPVVVSLTRLDSVFEENETVNTASLIEKGLIKADEAKKGIKIVGGRTPIQKNFTFDKEDSKLKLSKSVAE